MLDGGPMKHTLHRQSSFAILFDPALALAAADRAAQWDLPRRVCRPLDRYAGSRASASSAAYDAEVELAAIPEEEMPDEPPGIPSGQTADPGQDADFEDSDEL